MEYKNDEIKFDFNDITIVPAITSDITSRKQVNPFYNKYLPIIASPMDTVIDENNIHEFINNKIPVCIPRGTYIDLSKLNTEIPIFKSYSLDEFIDIFILEQKLDHIYALIDIANGNMIKLVDTIKKSKKMYANNLRLMVGNIANPETYKVLSEAGADYIRCGIGGGAGCFVENTLVNTENGTVFIKNIKEGDYVLTHNHNYRKVIGKTEYFTNEELININDNISTKDHKYYVLNKKYQNIVTDDNIYNYAEWIEAEKLTNDYLLIEINK